MVNDLMDCQGQLSCYTCIMYDVYRAVPCSIDEWNTKVKGNFVSLLEAIQICLVLPNAPLLTKRSYRNAFFSKIIMCVYKQCFDGTHPNIV